MVSKAWNLTLNPEKCLVIRFIEGRTDVQNISPVSHYFFHGSPPKCVESHRDLDLVVDNLFALCFHSHIRSTCTKLGPC